MKCPLCGSELKFEGHEWADEDIVITLECEKCHTEVDVRMEFEKVLEKLLDELLEVKLEG